MIYKYTTILLIGFFVSTFWNNLKAQSVLYDFDSVPLYASLPIDQTVNGITAHLSSTGQGYSIQNADVLGFTPVGFSGRILYPNSGTLSDLIIQFSEKIIQFSIMYTPNELGCDNSATMRVTAYLYGSYVGTSTKTASNPGTWPVDTLSCNFSQGFDSVIVHYDSPPPTCQDYGTIFMADNMRVTPFTVNSIMEEELPLIFNLVQNYPNPYNSRTVIRYQMPLAGHISLKVYDILGNEVASLVDGYKSAGSYEVDFDASSLPSGVYFYRIQSGDFVQTRKMILLK